MTDVLSKLASVLEDRKNADPSDSYVASLYSKGRGAMLNKIEEEANELVMAGKTGDTSKIVHETADLWFHTLLLLSYSGLGPDVVLDELEKRFGTSGLVEKANRSNEIKE